MRDFKRRPSISNIIKNIESSFRILRWVQLGRAGLLTGSVAINLLSIVFPLVILQAYDRILPNQATDTLLLLAIGTCFAIGLDAVMRIARSALLGRTSSRFVHLLKCTAIDRFLDARINDIEQEEPGVHLERLSSADTLSDFHTGQILVALVDFPFILLFLALIAYIGGILVAVPIGLFVIFTIIALLLGQAIRKVSQLRSQGEDRRHAFIIEVLTGVHTVKAFGMEAQMRRRYERLLGQNASFAYRLLRLGSRAQDLGALVAQLTILAVASAGSVFVINGTLTIGGLVACTFLSGRALQPMLKGISFWSQIQKLRAASDHVSEVFALVPDRTIESLPALPPLEECLEARKLQFHYKDSESAIIQCIDITFDRGKIVGICGDNGSGKTTLLNLIGGMLEPSSGELLYDGRSLSEFSANSIRNQIAYVPQRAVLFRGTLMENLTGFRKGPAVDRALSLVRKIGLDAKIAQFPEGFDTKIIDQGTDSLWPGLRQQIALVRALSTEPSVLLFDEANANLDSIDDALMRGLLASLRDTMSVILVSHRPSTLSLADTVFDLHDGMLTQISLALSSDQFGRSRHSEESNQ